MLHNSFTLHCSELYNHSAFYQRIWYIKGFGDNNLSHVDRLLLQFLNIFLPINHGTLSNPPYILANSKLAWPSDKTYNISHWP